jgi:hypothetical protein
MTYDFFTPIVDDPYDYGAIAAANALSDVYAMGGQPLLALNLVAFPSQLPLEILTQVMRVAFADTRWYVADPKFSPAPLDRLLSRKAEKPRPRFFVLHPSAFILASHPTSPTPTFASDTPRTAASPYPSARGTSRLGSHRRTRLWDPGCTAVRRG